MFQLSISEELHAPQKADVNIGAGRWAGIIYVTHSTGTQMVFSCERPLHLYFRCSHGLHTDAIISCRYWHYRSPKQNDDKHQLILLIILTIQIQLF